ncbi:sensor histidine kinase [Algoriphagus zhangzhouensis]|uniref:histidine kinase n=1 Tax=Algoriphagus zhangzhouensis TaxID=1073327 RepID=A0A1M7ZA17_9BACT|nr:ATP-binding protein [Algoriphagus zhangzhouensis]TDY47325.1 phospho-acceptor domain-containing protein [Algoriphagus zhangzhouensis]SHO61652.1 His Kinase A (phospho-acceptor) domain-containing protein [Algoriphagus zhangzhouensis]
MRSLLTFTFLILIQFSTFGQGPGQLDRKIEALQNKFETASSDSVKKATVEELMKQKIEKSLITTNVGDYANAYVEFRQLFEFWGSDEVKDLFSHSESDEKEYQSILSTLIFNYGHLMGVTGNINEQLIQYRRAFRIARKERDFQNMVFAISGMAMIHLSNGEIDSAKNKMERFSSIPAEFYTDKNSSDILFLEGMIKIRTEDAEGAKESFEKGLQVAKKESYIVGLTTNSIGLSKAYTALDAKDSSLYYGLQTLRYLRRIREIQLFRMDISTAYENLFEHFSHFNQPDSAYKYLELAFYEKRKFTEQNIKNLAAFQEVLLEREKKLSTIETEKLELQNQYRTNFLLTILAVLMLLGGILIYSYRQKNKDNKLLAMQKEEIQSTLEQLKSTQAQLIQSEKMASLGELTAGIAHEIQNPLNFVNNFSELSSELIDEMNEEIESGDMEEVKAISQDLKENLKKINNHGKRAGSIIRGMLEHSRKSDGHKELTDINKLVDESLRLSFHGLRAKDKDFNAGYKLNLDPDLPQLNVISQDLSRVLLNLINNAFYATTQKSKNENGDYQPEVIVTTKKVTSGVQISVKDNGSGIPDSIKEKIFQPFFTTKPTGEGTGLGLSLSYDIITKGHGGEIKVLSQEGQWTEFLILIPDTSKA